MSSRLYDKLPRNASSDASADEPTLYKPTSDDEGYAGRPSEELPESDHDILESEDERDRLLTQEDGVSGISGKQGVKIGKLSQKAGKKPPKRGQNEEESGLMYEMEEGIGQSSTSLNPRRSSESDEQRLLALRAHKKVHQACIRASQANMRYRQSARGYGDG
jgi:hypothetical protein